MGEWKADFHWKAIARFFRENVFFFANMLFLEIFGESQVKFAKLIE